MLTCSNCGATLREGARFCTACGTRLNEEVTANPESAWATASEPVVQDAPPVSAPDPDSDAATGTGGVQPTSDGDFSWTWGDPVEGDSIEKQASEATGVALDEQVPVKSESEEVDEAIVDATELDILEDDHSTSDEDDAVDADPEQTESLVSDDEDSVDRGDNETLAAWAEQWDESADESAGASASAEADNQRLSGGSGTTSESGNDEDTVAKAERLLGELRALMPGLVNPRPASPSSPEDPTVADDLDSAASIGHFDDVSEALLAARDNPRDVDNMLSLAGMVDRLLELLDDRNNLAKTAESAASRLRSSARPTMM
ncbi:hypothetical protein BH24CHL3_BH24CHL3_10460 [soil metagenome]